jgi:16S rRNA pseudouridine516 synthase
MGRKDTLVSLLHDQGFGDKRECLGYILSGQVSYGHPKQCGTIDWIESEDPAETPARDNLYLRVNGLELPYLDKLYLAFHKPADVECSRTPDMHASVFEFFPGPYLIRDLQPVGRLDADTTGLLLLTDDGKFNHAVTSPRRKLPKTYRVGLKHPVTAEQIAALEQGVVLRDDPAPTAPAKVARLAEREIDIEISEGRYHQVKRMAAAVGNRVESIHRTAIGPLALGELAEGEWRYLTEAEVQSLLKVG